jgi:hypothetical protein
MGGKAGLAAPLAPSGSFCDGIQSRLHPPPTRAQLRLRGTESSWAPRKCSACGRPEGCPPSGKRSGLRGVYSLQGLAFSSDFAFPQAHCRLAAEDGWRLPLECRLAYDELFISLAEGSLRLSAIPEQAQSLLAKQACHRLASGGWQTGHMAYWIGLRLRYFPPTLSPGLTRRSFPFCGTPSPGGFPAPQRAGELSGGGHGGLHPCRPGLHPDPRWMS